MNLSSIGVKKGNLGRIQARSIGVGVGPYASQSITRKMDWALPNPREEGGDNLFGGHRRPQTAS